MKIEELKTGHIFYTVDNTKIVKNTYVCLHPNNNQYHIIIGYNEEPKRVYCKDLENLIERYLGTYQEALQEMIKIQEDRLNMFKSFHEESLKKG